MSGAEVQLGSRQGEIPVNTRISRRLGKRTMCTRRPSALGLLVLCMLATLLPRDARAVPRVPQVPISGSDLQTFINGVGESINVRTDQDATSFLSTTVSSNSNYTMQVELFAKPAGFSAGIYDSSVPNPSLFEVFPAMAGAGWFAAISFRTSPVRAVVVLLDEQANVRSSVTYFGANRFSIGFYLETPGGRFYSQDARNPAGDPHLLFFRGTGRNSGDWWITGEELSLSGGSEGDFDDIVLYVDAFDCVCPVQRCTWGAAKARFR